MSYSYDRRAAFDPSVLGLTKAEIARMSPEEREEALVDSLNRAGDLCEAIVGAFGSDLDDKRKVVQVAKTLQGIARSVT